MAKKRGLRPAEKPAVPSGSGAKGHRQASTVDPAVLERNLQRLRRIEGQVRGLQRMVGEQRYCAEILVQISSVQEALRAVGKELLRHHLRHCAGSAIARGGREAEAAYDELLELMSKHFR